MEITANDLKNGSKFEYDNDVWVVIKNPVHTKPGKGGAYVQVEIKGVFSNTKTNKRFSSTEKFKKPYFEIVDMQYLYSEDSKLVLMNPKNYEQIEIDGELLGKKISFLQDGMALRVEYYKEKPVSIVLPSQVTLEVIETEPVIKGATVTSSFKPAILTNDIKVSVPPYITTGEKIVVKTEDFSFVERAK